MTKTEMYARLQTYGSEAAFLANVIMTQHRNPARRLRGLLTLLNHGRTVRVAAFDMHTLLVDGEREAWQTLDYPQEFLARF